MDDNSFAHSYALTARTFYNFLFPGLIINSEKKALTEAQVRSLLLTWPPNMFAFTSYCLQQTGSYAQVTNSDWLQANLPEDVPGTKADESGRKILDILENYVDNPELDSTPSERKSHRDELFQYTTLVHKAAIQYNSFLSANLRNPNAHFDKIHNDEGGFQDSFIQLPEAVRYPFKVLEQAMDEPGKGNIMSVNEPKYSYLIPFLLFLHAVADETCRGWGIRQDPSITTHQAKEAAEYSHSLLSKSGTMSTIHPDRLRVLPKRHVPQVGITLRSVSLNLIMHRSSIKVNWQTDGPSLVHPASEESNIQDTSIRSFPVLLLPWPLEIPATSFRGNDVHKQPIPIIDTIKRIAEQFEGKDNPEAQTAILDRILPWLQRSRHIGTFDYAGNDKSVSDSVGTLPELLQAARKEVGDIKLVVAPEACMNMDLLPEFEAKLISKPASNQGDKYDPVRAYVIGVREIRNEMPINKVVLGLYDRKTRKYRRHEQLKHHRWQLNDAQITAYQLGAQLHPENVWWENIHIGRREVLFANLGNELTLAPLICEDLARQDPISDLLRAVGPSLIVAILLDGPQVRGRWASKYASVLADDPGSSVLSVSSYGMVKRHKIQGIPTSNVIALWSDRLGHVVEIPLEKDAKAVALSLAVGQTNEFTLDERYEPEGTYVLTFGGYQSIWVKDGK